DALARTPVGAPRSGRLGAVSDRTLVTEPGRGALVPQAASDPFAFDAFSARLTSHHLSERRVFRSLELYGFKTFATRTRFEFDGALTAVVGPNGSGKSNVADAVRWILGEPSGRGLRVRRAEDLIFAGGPGRAGAGFAEVTITLDNAGGAAPLEFTEIVLTRRLYRTGDSEYWVNGQRVRQREAIDLLNRVGVPVSAYAVIGQGLIDQALSLRPEERRELLEEAADVRRHQARLEDTRERLAATVANLRRVSDLIAEIAPRVESLRRDAAAAEEHQRLAAELADLVAISHALRWRAAAAERGVDRRHRDAQVLCVEPGEHLLAHAAHDSLLIEGALGGRLERDEDRRLVGSATGLVSLRRAHGCDRVRDPWDRADRAGHALGHDVRLTKRGPLGSAELHLEA
ncbi:MAG: AAA family ATPase, partial [Dehalococcoidia bacterium]|nr:AAA family ATPase [Dehalococcoidia bacterium]